MIEFTTPALRAPDGCIVGVIEEGAADSWHRDGADDFGFRGTGRSGTFNGASFIKVGCGREGTRYIPNGGTASRGSNLRSAESRRTAARTLRDEIWWLRKGELIARGDPAEVLPLYRRHVAAALRASGSGVAAPLAPAVRNGDGRAVLESIELIGENGEPSIVWRSGETVSIQVAVRYTSEVANPVIGMLILDPYRAERVRYEYGA